MSILIVDDMKDERLLLERILRDAGLPDTILAESVKEAFDYLGLGESAGRAEEIDLILLDIIMPEIDGLEGLRRIRAEEPLQDIPVIMVTVKEEGESLKTALEIGAVDYITKPVDPLELLARVRSALRLKQEFDRRRVRDEKLKKSEEAYRSFAQIGLALSAEKNINKLLEMIVDEARFLTNSDAGTLYILDEEEKYLRFQILQNDSMNIRIGPTSGAGLTLPNVPLYLEGKPNYANVSSYAALTDETINIKDVYEAEGFDFTGPKDYDSTTGYRSKSMLVIPLKNHENDIIGVLQLLNAQDSETGEVVPFSADYMDVTASLASQAAVALTNAQLIQDLRDLFYAFIRTIAAAIDEKSPYTWRHINRVVDLTMLIGNMINRIHEGPFEDVNLTYDQLEELRMAAWMHDVGKITTPEYIVDKSAKLQTILDTISLIEMRFQYIAKSIENSLLRQHIEMLQKKRRDESEKDLLDETMAGEIKSLQDDFEFIKACDGSFQYMSDDHVHRVKEIAAKKYSINNENLPYLTEDEVKNLCIRKGNLNQEERKIIEDHVRMTEKILSQLPFPKSLARVPEFACEHHEKLDGSGYPRGLSAEDLALQSRIIAFADIFEALTAKDRPYRKPMMLSQAINIMSSMKKEKHIDPDIYDLFFQSALHLEYAKNELDQEQID